MLADGRTVPHDEVVETAVCVIGAGPAGIALATELVSAGIEVLLLERGGRRPQVPPSDPETATSTGIRYPIGRSRAFELGGSVHKWDVPTPLGGGLGRLRELDREDFERRSWIPNSGWPFGKDELASFYARAWTKFQWFGLNTDPNLHELMESQEPELASNDGIRTRMFVFGDPSSVAGEMIRRLELAPTALVLTNSAAVELRTMNGEAMISSVRVATDAGTQFEVKGDVYVLAAGGIENPRLLLASRSANTDGVGNTYGLVGRFFMEHPHYRSGLFATGRPDVFSHRFDSGIHIRNGVPMQTKYSLPDWMNQREMLNRVVFRFDKGGEVLGSPDELMPAFRSMEAARDLRRALARRSRVFRRSTLQAAGLAMRGPQHIVRHVLSRKTSKGSSSLESKWFRIRAMAEQIPNENSRVELTDRLDRYSVPQAKLNWRLTDQDRWSMYQSQALFGRLLSWEPNFEVQSLVSRTGLPPEFGGGYHHMGTTRMHASPRSGVVDANCRVHGVPNLYVVGSSVFPTGGYTNPTLTIIALSIRLADHVRSLLKS